MASTCEAHISAAAAAAARNSIKKEMTYGLEFLQDLIRLFLLRDFGLLYPPHSLYVLPEVALQRCIHGRVVDRHKIGEEIRRAQGDGHGGLRAHRMTNKGRFFEGPLGNERLYIFCKRGVVVPRMVGRFAVITKVLAQLSGG